MEDFAKLFRFPEIGQVLVTLIVDEDDIPTCRFRIPDEQGLTLEMNINIKNCDDWDKQDKFSQDIFDAVTESNVLVTIKPLLDAKKRLMQ